MIQVVVKIQAKPGQRDAVLNAFKANAPAVRAEQGCIEYAAFVDAAGLGSLAPTGTILLSSSKNGNRRPIRRLTPKLPTRWNIRPRSRI